MNEYMELSWEHWQEYNADTGISTDEFVQEWADLVSKTLTGIKKEEITALFDANDKHNSEQRSRAYWKYGASNGISGAP